MENNATEETTLLYKLKLQTNFALDLYNYLSYMGYYAARTFPGYQGGSRKMSEDLLYNKIIRNRKPLGLT